MDVDSVQLNIAAADPRFQPDADPTTLRMIADEALPLGDPAALARRMSQVATEAGLTIVEELDPTALRTGRPPAQPGVYNRTIVLRRSSSLMTRSLLRDLRDLFRARPEEWRKTAAGRLLGSVVDSKSRPVPIVSIHAMNDSQERAVHQAFADPVTVITGPPGTGKSQLVAALVATARERDMSVLEASTNNAAVDEAVSRANAAHPGTILRTGNAECRRELTVRLENLSRGSDETADRASARASHRARATRRDEARATIGRRAELLRQHEAMALDAGALAADLWGGSVPPGVRDRAREVLDRATRLRRAWWRFVGRRRLIRDLAVIHVGSTPETLDKVKAWAEIALHLQTAHQTLDLDANTEELRAFRARDDRWQVSARALVAAEVQTKLHDGAERLDRLVRAQAAGDRGGSALVDYLDILPAWATSALSVRPNFRCRPGMFDLLIIDEASQCTLPAVLPLAFRAKRIVVVGDPNQLPPVVTLTATELERLPGVAGLDYAELTERRQRYGVDSSYDAFRRLVSTELLLDEHYRCHPVLAAFCDEQFYDNRLHVLTDTTRWSDAPIEGLTWSQVEGHAEPGTTSGRINVAEADAIARWACHAALPLASAGTTLGVVTPFAAQARLIEKQLRSVLDEPTRRSLNLRVGTAHRFQGGERDIMLFSAVVTPGVPDGTIGWLESNRHLVNVAVSRARAAMIVFGDARHLRRLGAATLESLREHAVRAIDDGDVELRDVERLLITHLADELDVRVGERVAGYRCHLTLSVGEDQRILLVADSGQPDAAARIRDLTRDHIAQASGAEVLRIPAWLIRYAPEAIGDVVEGVLSGRPATPATEHAHFTRRSCSGPRSG